MITTSTFGLKNRFGGQRQPRIFFMHVSTPPKRPSGFTLPELLVAMALGSGVVLLAGNALLSHMQSSALAESLQRKRDDASRTTSFIESEIAMSERVLTNTDYLNVPTSCSNYKVTKDNTKLILDIDRRLPVVLYAVVDRASLDDAEKKQWIGDYLLVRCGPNIGTGAPNKDISGTAIYEVQSGTNIDDPAGANYDDYRPGPAVASVLIDGLAKNSCGNFENGFCVTPNSSKSASIILALSSVNKNITRPFQLAVENYSRINPASAYPEYLSICDVCVSGSCDEKSNIYVNQGTPNSETIDLSGQSANVIICGLGGGDILKAGKGSRNVIDAGKESNLGADITGGAATSTSTKKITNYLFGTKGNDNIRTQSDYINTLVGRCGNDTLTGGNRGINNFLPWDQTCFLGNELTTINGGIDTTAGTDIVYLRGLRGDFEVVSNCTRSSCTIRKGLASLTANNVEVFVFNDERLDLR